MKLKTIILATAAAGTLLASTASMAGFKLKDTSSVPQSNIYVSCNGGVHVKGIFDTNLAWSVVNALFLKFKSEGTCTFYNGSAEIGSGYLNIYNNKTGKVTNVNVTSSTLKISISPAQGTKASDISVIVENK